MRLNGSYIGTTPAPSTLAAPGIWTLDEAARYQQAGAWPKFLPVVPVTTGLVAWYMADFGTLDASGNQISTDNTAIATWQDQSGNNYHITQSTSGNRPAWRSSANGQNSLPIVSFNGSSSFLQAATSIGISGTSARTVFTVQKDYNPGASVYPAVLYWGAASSGAYYAHIFNNSLAYIDNYASSASVAISAGSFSVLTSKINATPRVQIRRNGDSWSVNGTAFNTTNSALTVGRGITNAYLNTTVAEILIYNQNLSDTDCASVESYLRARWGF